MDPNATLLALATYPGRERTRELRQALADWLVGGGFQPDWYTCRQATREFVRWAKRYRWDAYQILAE